jgi:hypothetical protein
MAQLLPPIPKEPLTPDSHIWRDWFNNLRNILIGAIQGVVSWASINFTGSNITDIVTRRHSDLQGLQGGTAGQYYHLTAAQYTTAVSVPYGSFQSESQTTLTGTMTNVSTTPIAVVSTAGYTAPGSLLIGTELITYTTITSSTTFDGTITRGAYGSTKATHAIADLVSAVQGATAATATPVYLNTTDYSNQVALSAVPSSLVVLSTAGLYNIQFSVQSANYTNTTDNITMWLQHNGADLVGSGGILTVPSQHAGIAGNALTGWNYFVRVVATDTVALYWTTDNGNSVLINYPAGVSPTHPASPAIILTVTFVAT